MRRARNLHILFGILDVVDKHFRTVRIKLAMIALKNNIFHEIRCHDHIKVTVIIRISEHSLNLRAAHVEW